jgi:hypothetical protein
MIRASCYVSHMTRKIGFYFSEYIIGRIEDLNCRAPSILVYDRIGLLNHKNMIHHRYQHNKEGRSYSSSKKGPNTTSMKSFAKLELFFKNYSFSNSKRVCLSF